VWGPACLTSGWTDAFGCLPAVMRCCVGLDSSPAVSIGTSFMVLGMCPFHHAVLWRVHTCALWSDGSMLLAVKWIVWLAFKVTPCCKSHAHTGAWFDKNRQLSTPPPPIQYS
jgi:hypothetical protein